MGELIYKAPPPHEHDYPILNFAAGKQAYPEGSIWKCECGREFRADWKYDIGSWEYMRPKRRRRTFPSF